jgi:hypothetical protein
VAAAGSDDAQDTRDKIDRLFAVRPADFVKERDALARALRTAGKRDEAADVAKLPRPTPSVWAVNQLARHVPALVQRLGEATARLQEGGAGSYADALAAHRDVLKALRAKAEEILEAAALRPTLDVLTRVVHDLRAGVLNPSSRPLVESGRLERDVVEESAVNPFEQELPSPAAGGGQPPLTPVAPDTGAASRRAEAEAREARSREEARLARLERLKRLRETVASAEAAHERGEKAVEAARRALNDAERTLAGLRTALTAAEAALEKAEAAGTSS